MTAPVLPMGPREIALAKRTAAVRSPDVVRLARLADALEEAIGHIRDPDVTAQLRAVLNEA